PLVDEPGVRPLLDALGAVIDSVGTEQQVPTVETAESLLLSPLGGLQALELRALGRAFRQREVAAAVAEQRPALSSGELVARALVAPAMFDGLDSSVTRKARALADLVAATGQALESGEDVEALLWHLWSGTDWGSRMRNLVLRGGGGA